MSRGFLTKMVNDLAQKISSSRKEAGLSQTDLSKMVNVGLQTVHRWESGKVKKVPFNILQKISEATKKPLSYFISDDNEITVDKKDINLHRIPVVSWEDVHLPFEKMTPVRYLESVCKRGNTFAVEIINENYRPEFCKGDFVVISNEQTILHNSFVLAIRNSKPDIYQYKKYDSPILETLNADAPIKEPIAPYGNFKIIGRIIEKITLYST